MKVSRTAVANGVSIFSSFFSLLPVGCCVSQYWDKPRVVSRSMGETDHDSIVWDIVAVYQPGKVWQQAPPEPSYSGGPVVEVIDETRNAIKRELESVKQ